MQNDHIAGKFAISITLTSLLLNQTCLKFAQGFSEKARQKMCMKWKTMKFLQLFLSPLRPR